MFCAGERGAAGDGETCPAPKNEGEEGGGKVTCSKEASRQTILLLGDE